MREKFDEADYFDWYDYDAVEKFHEKQSLKWIKIYKKMMDAHDKGDEKALDKAKEDMRRHEAKTHTYKQKAQAAGYYWS